MRRSATSLIILLLAAFLFRVHLLTEIPPGLTHDEANHGREAIGILGGNLALFFPLNYGSEPLYSYTVAALMALIGRGVLALRLVIVYFNLLALSATYLWGRLALGRTTGWLAAALIAVSFWPLASSREALRAGMMPFFTSAAMIFFWLLLQRAQAHARSGEPAHGTPRDWILVAGLALCLSAALYNYLAARALWLVFPFFLLYLAFVQRRLLLRRLWPGVVAALFITALLVTPLFLYLYQHPEAQTRLQMFAALDDLQEGNLAPLLENATGALLAFVWPGYGDQFLAYNLPGRPVFIPLTALFFLLGVAFCLWRWRRPRYAFLLIWFVVGVAPSLLTGATANTTRNVGAMPAAFLLPAVGFVALERHLRNSGRKAAAWLARVAAGIWLVWVVWTTAGDYFVRWGRAPEVRAAYQHTLVEQLAYAKANTELRRTVISSVVPGPAHDQSIGLVLLPEAHNVRWVDARSALILPRGDGGDLLVPAATPLHPAFEDWVEPLDTVTLRPDDLDPSFTVYRLGPVANLPEEDDRAVFGQSEPALTLLGSRWLTEQVQAGETGELLQVWRVDDATAVGPVQAAIGGTDVILFTHIIDQWGYIVAQQDRVDAPSTSWRTGDLVVQVHRITLPPWLAQGIYTVVVGVYDRASQQPLPVLGEEGRWDATRAKVDSLNIIP